MPNLKATTAIPGAFAGAWTIASMRKMLCVAIVTTMAVGAPAPASAKNILECFKTIVMAPVKMFEVSIGVRPYKTVTPTRTTSDLETCAG